MLSTVVVAVVLVVFFITNRANFATNQSHCA